MKIQKETLIVGGVCLSIGICIGFRLGVEASIKAISSDAYKEKVKEVLIDVSNKIAKERGL